MIITTATTNNDKITSCSLFDTQTGIKYSLTINPNNAYTPFRIKLDIESAHTRSAEGGDYPGVTYNSDEAIDFWQRLIEAFGLEEVTMPNDALYAACKCISDYEFATQIAAHKSGEKSIDSIELPF